MQVTAHHLYNTCSWQVLPPLAKNTGVPAVHGQHTGHFARQISKFANKNKSMKEATALLDETKFYQSCIKHMVECIKNNTCKIQIPKKVVKLSALGCRHMLWDSIRLLTNTKC